MKQLFSQHIITTLPFLREKKLLVAISGGLDSVVLTHLIRQLQFSFSLAHCNFNLRGAESEADEDFVLQLSEELEVEVFVESFNTENYAQEHKISIQMAARELRYSWFDELSNQLGFDYILTAHHADDNLETFLINLSRGTGLEGLTGIPQQNGRLVRPLLPFSREEIESYAVENKLKWREDSSNASTKYLRNKLRHDVIPKLKEINPQLLQNFIKTQSHLQKSQHIVEVASSQVLSQVMDKVEGSVFFFNIEKLKAISQPRAFLYVLLKDYGFTEWEDVYNLLSAQSGKFVQSSTHKLLKNRDQLILSELVERDFIEISIPEQETKMETPFGTLHFETTQQFDESDSSTIYVDKDLLKYPLSVRHWKNGNYFYPFGMQGRKKLSKFFKDEKLSALEKEKILLLCSQDRIVWIINHRLDNRFKITKETKTILKITLL